MDEGAEEFKPSEPQSKAEARGIYYQSCQESIKLRECFPLTFPIAMIIHLKLYLDQLLHGVPSVFTVDFQR